MTVETAVRLRLLQITALTARVAPPNGGGIWVARFPQGLKADRTPANLVQKIGGAQQMHFRGRVRTMRARVQVDSLGLKQEVADEIDALVDGDGNGPSASGLLGWKGSVGGSPAFQIVAVYPIDARSGYDGDELKQYRVMRDYWVWFRA